MSAHLRILGFAALGAAVVALVLALLMSATAPTPVTVARRPPATMTPAAEPQHPAVSTPATPATPKPQPAVPTVTTPPAVAPPAASAPPPSHAARRRAAPRADGPRGPAPVFTAVPEGTIHPLPMGDAPRADLTFLAEAARLERGAPSEAVEKLVDLAGSGADAATLREAIDRELAGNLALRLAAHRWLAARQGEPPPPVTVPHPGHALVAGFGHL